MTAPTPPDDLQFTTAEPTTPLTPDSDATALACAECQRPITVGYYTVGGRPRCASCKTSIERALAGEGTSRAGRITKSLVYGFGAALVGAAIWFAVAAMFGLEIGIIAILTGWMVGRAVRKGSGERGGRRYQVVAALLTYLSVAMSYGALGIRELVQERSASSVSANSAVAKSGLAAGPTASNVEAVAMDGSIVPASASATDSASTDSASTPAAARDSSAKPLTGGAFALGIAAMLGFMFVLPIIANISGGGIISLAIIGFGIVRAWQMNAVLNIPITGPHRVGANANGTGERT